jgi:A/G-specific adenine glycosylase
MHQALNSSQIKKLRKSLIEWYLENRRSLPWRATKDPYFIWVSEVMLQQTTIQAATPYYHRFIAELPTVESLAQTSEANLMALWAGLGYYSRARNLQLAAKLISQNGFPRSALKLSEMPGFGPYTSRAVSSLAFGEKVGVLDGNVNRVLTRLLGFKQEWWTTSAKNQLQQLADDFAQTEQVSELNQGLMELGATVCTPRSPVCTICPWVKSCKTFATKAWTQIPKPKKKREIEIWLWQPELHLNKKNEFALVKNPQVPFLKNSYVFPGVIKKQTSKPKTFDLKHSITHFEIFIKLKKPTSKIKTTPLWVDENKLSSINPSSSLKKIIDAYKIKFYR